MPAIGEEAREIIEGGAVILVATRSASMHPFITRGWGARVLDDGARVAVEIGRGASARTLDDLECNGCVAVSFGEPLDVRAVQIKGACVAIEEPDEAALARTRAQFAMFASKLERLGVPSHVARGLLHHDLLTLTVSVEAAFDQTPGRGAGKRL